MRRWILIVIVILFYPLTGISQRNKTNDNTDKSLSIQTESYLNSFLQIDDKEASAEKFLSLINHFERKRGSFKTDHEFLYYLFVKIHQKVLRHYTQYCSFSDLANSRTYNCLTGTALYAILLSHFNYDYNIIETNYHIFLIAKTSKGDVLIEATDPLSGFITSAVEIEKQINTYRENEIIKGSGNKKYYRYSFSLYNTVNLNELLGLVYYNYSILAYNEHRFIDAINYLEKTMRYYSTQRIEEFSKVILLTVLEAKTNLAEREFCLKKIQSLRRKPFFVSLNQ